MKLRISALFLALAALAAVLVTQPARAQAEGPAPTGPLLQQNEIRISTLKTDLWPEYDRPSVLVIYHITLDSSVTLPVDLAFRIPAAAGEPNALATGLSDDTTALQNVDYERTVNGDWATLDFTATMPVVRLEYYDTGLVKQGTSRSFTYTWPGDYAVSKMIVEVQQPAGARDMSLNPDLGSSVLDNDGLLYYRADLGSRQVGEEQNVSMVYQKDTDTLSVENVAVEPSEPIVTGESGFTALNGVLPWLLGVVGVVLLAGGGLWYWQSGKSRVRPAQARRRRKQPAAERETAQVEGHVYCHQCGKRAAANDRFCRTCGARLRIE